MTDPVTPTEAPDEQLPADEVRWYKVRMSEEVFEALGTRVVWGEPDAEGFYTPTVYTVQTTDTVNGPERFR